MAKILISADDFQKYRSCMNNYKDNKSIELFKLYRFIFYNVLKSNIKPYLLKNLTNIFQKK